MKSKEFTPYFDLALAEDYSDVNSRKYDTWEDARRNASEEHVIFYYYENDRTGEIMAVVYGLDHTEIDRFAVA